MANIQPSPDYAKKFPPATDADDLLLPDGNLSHGGRTYRRELTSHLVSALLLKRGYLSEADLRAALSTAERTIAILVAAPPHCA